MRMKGHVYYCWFTGTRTAVEQWILCVVCYNEHVCIIVGLQVRELLWNNDSSVLCVIMNVCVSLLVYRYKRTPVEQWLLCVVCYNEHVCIIVGLQVRELLWNNDSSVLCVIMNVCVLLLVYRYERTPVEQWLLCVVCYNEHVCIIVGLQVQENSCGTMNPLCCVL